MVVEQFDRSRRVPRLSVSPYKPKPRYRLSPLPKWDSETLHFKYSWKKPLIAGAIAAVALAGSYYYAYNSGYKSGVSHEKKEVRHALLSEKERYNRYLNDNPTEYETRKSKEFINGIDNSIDILEYRRVLDREEIKQDNSSWLWLRAFSFIP